MSNRERWIVYPLLLFAFLLAARDKYVQPETAEYNTISCQRLTITSVDGRPLIRLGATQDDAGLFVLYGCGVDPELPGLEPTPDIRDARPRSHQAVEISAARDGGYLRVYGNRPGVDLQLRHDGDRRMSGLMAVGEHGEYLPQPPENEEGDLDVPWGIHYSWQHLRRRLFFDMFPRSPLHDFFDFPPEDEEAREIDRDEPTTPSVEEDAEAASPSRS